MAKESSALFGSGVAPFRQEQNVLFMQGTNAIVVNPEDIAAGLGTLQASGIAVAATPIHLVTDSLPGRRELRIQNLGPGKLYIGPDIQVSIEGSYEVGISGSITLPMMTFGSVWGISDSTSDVRVLQLK